MEPVINCDSGFGLTGNSCVVVACVFFKDKLSVEECVIVWFNVVKPI